MDSTNQPLIVISNKDEGFPVSAIVVLAIGGYMLIFVVVLIIRKCVLNKGGTCFPSWCAELCACQNCCNGDPNERGCVTKCAEALNCNVPNKRQCMDTVCPTKEWCDRTFCCCMSQQPQGECCNCGGGTSDMCNCGDCQNDCCDCKDCCNDCRCDCCAQPDAVNCCCIEIKLTGSGNQPPGYGGSLNQHGQSMNQRYNNQYTGGYMNQEIVNRQPSFQSGQSFNAGQHSMGQFNPTQSFAAYSMNMGHSSSGGQFNPTQSFSANPGMSFNPGQSSSAGRYNMQQFAANNSVPT